MATLTVRDLDDAVRDRLRVRAARNGRSMEAEVRFILADAVSPAEQTLFDLLLQARERTGGVDLDPFLPARDEPHRDPLV